jgi:glycerophosphoryl diester phosphodiesterase
MPAASILTMLRLTFLALCFAQSVFSIEIIAHRGASFDAPENTLAAMKLAWEQNADAIELDLWLSKDGRLVVFHDADGKRIAGVARRIADLTLAEVQQFDVGTWKNSKFKGERVPTLESILATIPKGRRAVLEIKCGPEIVPELKRVLDAAKRSPRELAIISFNFDSLKKSRETFPDIEHYFLHSYKKDPATGGFPELKPLIARAQAARFTGLNLHFDWPIDDQFVREVKSAGLKMLVWTVNDATVAKRLVSAGVDAITTDRPGWLREQIK